MKRIVSVSMLVWILMLTGCAGTGDWAYDALPGEYSIWRLNSQDIQLVKANGSSGAPVVGRYIIAFCNDDRYIGLQRIPLESQYSGVVNIDTLDKTNPEFYLVDTETDTIYGPWTQEEYYDRSTDLGISGMCEWIPTDPKPAGAR